MASAQRFSGRWVLEVVAKQARLVQRFVIEGSDASDGRYPGETTTPPLEVAGPRWSLRCEWNDGVGSGWRRSDVRRTGASYTVDEGLVTVIGADDGFEPQGRDFGALVLRCRSLDPQLNPRIPLRRAPDFTLPGRPHSHHPHSHRLGELLERYRRPGRRR